MDEAKILEALGHAEKRYEEGSFNKSRWGDFWIDDGSVFEVVDSAGQYLMFREGVVFEGGSNKPSGTPGIWIDYQEHFYCSPMTGCLLLSPETFGSLVKYYNRCKRRNAWYNRILWRIKCWFWDTTDWLKDAYCTIFG